MQQTAQLEQAKMQQAIQAEQVNMQLEQAKLQLEQAKVQQDAQQNAQKMAEDAQQTMLKEQAENERTKIELQTRYQMNTDDNNTALRLAATELATGEKFAVSTGTGVNPGV
jgi:sRNA-binding protein